MFEGFSVGRFVLAVVGLVSSGPALASEWIVARVTGGVLLVSADASRSTVSPGTVVPLGATLMTQAGGRVLLARDQETITVGPATTITLQGSNVFGLTTVQQQRGRVDVDVEKRNVRHFAVETPMLAAVVKGTRFSVTVSRSRVDVRVSRGVVEVNDAAGHHGEVVAGQRASSRAGKTGIDFSQPRQADVARTTGHQIGWSGGSFGVSSPSGPRSVGGDSVPSMSPGRSSGSGASTGSKSGSSDLSADGGGQRGNGNGRGEGSSDRTNEHDRGFGHEAGDGRGNGIGRERGNDHGNYAPNGRGEQTADGIGSDAGKGRGNGHGNEGRGNER